MLRVLIIDDEKPARDKLKRQLSQIPNVELVGEGQSAEEAIELLQSIQPDVLLLDIEMGALSGFDLLDMLEVNAHIIFTTAYSQFALQAFEKRAVDYLLKPFNLSRLQEALDRITEPQLLQTAAPKSEETRIAAKVGEKIHLLEPSEVLFIQSRHSITFARTKTREFAIESPLEKLQEILTNNFVRIHRNCLANCHFISQLERWRNGNYLVRFKDSDLTATSSRQGTANLKTFFNL